MYHQYLDSEIRTICKERIESLEYWLRRIIDQELSVAYGDYFDFSDAHGNRLFKASISDEVKRRREHEPRRYPRLIDAALLDDAISIITNDKLYKAHFGKMLVMAFPDGVSEARTFMKRLLGPRNSLSHANPLSIREVERVMCYSNDIIDSIKEYYAEMNLSNEYNVPLILRVTDSFGNVYFRDQLDEIHDKGICKYLHDDPRCDLHVGDVLSVEIEVDPSFSEDSYEIRWGSTKAWSDSDSYSYGKRLVVKIGEKQVGQRFDVQCRIVSTNKIWQRMHLGADDFLMLTYRVLPPGL